MKIANTLSGQKEEFAPQSDVVLMYVCGVTPYDYCHFGHALSYVAFDTIRRYLKFKGYQVKCVQNFTDIDDKIIERANKQGIKPADLAQKFIDDYFVSMDALNILRADVYPRATEEVPKIIEIIEGLVRNGHAYAAPDGVYFRVKSIADYGKLSHQSIDSLMAGSRVEPGAGKEHPLDFALWKIAKPGEPSWPSPWGGGRPGWHIECSAMSVRYLGETIDIHGGGQDLIFPHHENEIAQSEGFTGKKPFVKYWLHNGLLQLGSQKMSKSLGNLITVREALQKYSRDAIRLFILSSHYRSPLTYSEEGLAAAEKGADRLREAARLTSREGAGAASIDLAACKKRFVEVMDDDFNSAGAVGILFDLIRDINRERESGRDIVPAQALLAELGQVLGFTFKQREDRQMLEARPFIELLIATRNDLRKNKQWQLADNIRNQLLSLGIVIEDTERGTVWKKAS